MREEEDSRKAKEMESEQRKKDHKEMMDKMNERQDEFLKKLSVAQNANGGTGAGVTPRGPKRAAAADQKAGALGS